MLLEKEGFEKIKRWIYQNARPIEWARWRYHFEAGSKEDVLECLKAYQNADGGFGNCLEADSWNPQSSPITTGHAVIILKEIGFKDSDQDMIQMMLKYIENAYNRANKRWDAVLETNNAYPHAPWWTYGDGCNEGWGYNPTAMLLGFVLAYGDRTSAFYREVGALSIEIMTHYISGVMDDGNYYHRVKREGEIRCLNTLADFIEEAGLSPDYPVEALKTCMKAQIHVAIESDASKWMTYCSRPSEFIKGPASFYIEGFEKIIEDELDFLLGKRNADGVWDITWAWADYESAFAVSQNWWKAHLAIENMELLKAFGRME